MKKKSFWLGFGVGVLFSALILGVSCLVRTSNANIISQAKKLGMVFEKENDSAGVTKKADEASGTEAPAKATGSAAPQKTAKSAPKASEDPNVVPTPEGAEESAAPTPKATKSSMAAEKDKMEKGVRSSAKQLEIKAGDWSGRVSETLEKMGIVKNAKDFDVYLNQNGYSESINAGTYTVSPDDTYRELARKITGK